ncbi:lipopolysaccharide biosynthesis protein [Pontibacter sp. BT731]|uniref:lipopolysaccharide biosynthesis protein n=1 Tax=Pontibacter coccineus TaxID=3063328 RepID=UPI0026E24BE1|nr:lipopolysaccharide biosynthesis protein [Pontibacter sp. BT731]MDO6390226.1 lipopolysaccharide biosynthesis protein [Pontibacter sp. BT731]
MSLKQKTLSALFWTFSQQFGVQFINFFVSVLLARSLMPAEFGLIGMLSIFIGIGSSLIDSGLTSSLIRTPQPDERDYSTVFFINLVSSIIIYIILFFSSPYIAAFYEQPILESIVQIYTLSFIINAFASVQRTKLTKEMNFKIQMTIQIPSIICSGCIGVALAYTGYGVWSLVFMNLFQSLISTIQLWVRSGWYPSLIFDIEKFKYHFNFGYKLTLSGILDTVYSNIYNLIIGKFFSAAQLGFYTRAQSLKMLPVKNISSALNKVTYPLFSSIQNDNIKLKEVYRRLMQQVVFWLAPTMIYLAVVAEPLFRVLIGEKWMPAVPYFQILCAVGIMYPIHSYNLNILNVKGRSDLHLKLEIIKKIIITIGIACAIPFGIYGLLYFQLISSSVSLFINSWYSGKLINYPIIDQFKDLIPEIIIALVTGTTVWSLDNYVFNNIFLHDLFRISTLGIVYFTMYLVISYISSIPAIIDFKQLVLKK